MMWLSSYIDKVMAETKDTTKLIWDYLFKVRIPYIQSRSIEDIKQYGVPICGEKDVDNDIHNQWMTTMLSIAKMVDYYKDGVPIKIVVLSDIDVIYEYVSKHIYAWEDMLRKGINIGDAPIDDLIAMDAFATSLFNELRYTPNFNKKADAPIATHLLSLQRINPNNFFSNASLNKLNTDVNQELPERDSFAEFFRDRLISIRNNRYVK